MAPSQPMEEWIGQDFDQWRPNKISVYLGIIVESMAAITIRSVMLGHRSF